MLTNRLNSRFFIRSITYPKMRKVFKKAFSYCYYIFFHTRGSPIFKKGISIVCVHSNASGGYIKCTLYAIHSVRSFAANLNPILNAWHSIVKRIH